MQEKFFSIVTDHLGTPLEVYGIDGQRESVLETDAYGKLNKSTSTNPHSCPFRYQGQYEDAELELYYNRFRYYDPEIGLYISQDPIGLAGGDRLYAYVHDTTSWVDILGLEKTPATLPNKPGIYILTNGRESYVGSAGIGS